MGQSKLSGCAARSLGLPSAAKTKERAWPWQVMVPKCWPLLAAAERCCAIADLGHEHSLPSLSVENEAPVLLWLTILGGGHI